MYKFREKSQNESYVNEPLTFVQDEVTKAVQKQKEAAAAVDIQR